MRKVNFSCNIYTFKEKKSNVVITSSIKIFLLLNAILHFAIIGSAQDSKSEKPPAWPSDCFSNNSDEAKINWVKDNYINGCKFISSIIPPNYIANVELGNNFDKSSFFYHHYYIETEICDTKKCSQCNEKYVYNLMTSNKSLCVPTTDTTPMHNCEATFLDEVALGIHIYKTDPIITTLQPKEYSIVNYTVKINFKEEVLQNNGPSKMVKIGDKTFKGPSYEHILHPGKTQRTVFKRGDKIYIGTLGDGIVKGSIVNNCLGKILFSKIDEALVAAFKCKEPPGSISRNATFVSADEIFPFSEGHAVVKKDNSEAMINDKGKIVIDFGVYDFDEEGFKYGLCKVYKPSNITYSKTITGFVNTGGNLVIPYKYAYASFFLPNIGVGDLPTAVVGRTEKHLIDKNGNDVGTNPRIELDGDKVTLAPIEEGHGETRRFGFIDYTRKIIIPATFIRVHYFHEGLAAAKKGRSFLDSKWGFINEKGETVIPFIYDKEPGDFYSDRAFVQLNEIKVQNKETKIQYSYIDKQGKIIQQLTQKSTHWCFYNNAFDPTLQSQWMGFSNGFVLGAGSDDCVDYSHLLDVYGNKYDITKAEGDFTHLGTKFSEASSIFVWDFLKEKIDIKENTILFKWVCQNPKNFVNDSYLTTFGLMSPTAKMILPPVFMKLTRFDPVSQLAYAVYRREDGSKVEGYIDGNGIFQIVKQ